MESNQDKVQAMVNLFIDQWRAYALNPAASKVPLNYMHLNYRKYYMNRMRTLMDVEERLKTATGSEVLILSQKQAVIRKDFEDLYRQWHNLPREQAY